MQVGFSELQGTTDPPTCRQWRCCERADERLGPVCGNREVVAAIDLGVPATLGTWYGVQLDLDALTGSVDSRITDVATGATLLDSMTSLLPFGAWDPAIDGRFDIEGFFGGEVSAKDNARVGGGGQHRHAGPGTGHDDAAGIGAGLLCRGPPVEAGGAGQGGARLIAGYQSSATRSAVGTLPACQHS